MNAAHLTDTSLNELLLHIYEDQDMYGIAAKHVQDEALASFIDEKLQERLQVEAALKKLLKERAVRSEQQGTLIGKARMAWLDIKAVFSNNTKETLINGLYKGDCLTLRYFKKLLKKLDLSAEQRRVVEQQMALVNDGIKQLETMKSQA